jgi:hypothetical protein
LESIASIGFYSNFIASTLNNFITKLIREIQSNIGKLQDKGHPNWKKVDFNFSEIKWEIHPISESIFGL